MVCKDLADDCYGQIEDYDTAKDSIRRAAKGTANRLKDTSSTAQT